ncbi:response regulator [Endothiovibrio diazotrophicus]
MEKTIRILYVEDDPSDRAYFSNMLRDAFRGLQDLELDLQTVDNVDQAHDLLDGTEESPMELYLVDLNFAPPDQPYRLNGLPFINSLRDRFGKVAIIAISSMDPKVREKAEKAGADDILNKPKLWSDPKATHIMQQAVRGALEKHGLIALEHTPGKVEIDEKNRSLMAALKQVGLSTVTETVTKIESVAYSRIEIKLVSGGMSGAQTFAVECTPKAEPGLATPTKHFLVKMDRDRADLTREWKNGRKVLLEKNFPTTFVLPLLDTEPKELKKDGWVAVVGSFDSDACSFEGWLTDNALGRERLHSALEQLCLFNLGKVFSATATDASSPIDCYRRELLKDSRIARVLAALKELGALIPLALKEETFTKVGDAVKGAVDFDERVVFNFLERGDLGGISLRSLPDHTVLCYSHGDLHGRNILIAKDAPLPLSQLIDFSHTGTLPRCADLSMLAASLLARCLDAGPRGYRWESMADWVQCACLFLDENADGLDALSGLPNLDGSEKGQASVQTLWTLAWIARHWRQVLPETPLWELTLAMAIQFLRLSYFQDCTAPKRVFGLIMASIALKACVRQFDAGNMEEISP